MAKEIAAAVIAAAFTVQLAHAGPAEKQIEQQLKAVYPEIRIDRVSESPVSGIYEVKSGKSTIHVSATGEKQFFGGAIIPLMPAPKAALPTALPFGPQAAPTQPPVLPAPEAARQVAWSDLPLHNAFTVGSGTREIALFSDPDCPFCQRVEQTLAAMPDVKVHVFMYPIDSLHPAARAKSVSVWCSDDRASTWRALLLQGQQPDAKECANPIAENVALAQRLGVNGTPTMIVKASGRLVVGAQPKEALDAEFSR